MIHSCHRRSFLGMGGILLALAGCASTDVETTAQYKGSRLARPSQVIVAPFTALAQDVRLDQGVGARVARAVEDEPANQAELQAARAAQAALQTALVQALRAKGLPAEAGRAENAHGTAMLVQGQIVSLDEGNRTRRTLIGFGAGRSSMTSEVQLFHVAGRAAPQFLESFEAVTAGPRTPGLALPLGAGAAAGHAGLSAVVGGTVQGTSEVRRAQSNPDAQRLAEAVAERVAGFAAGQGWIPPRR